VDMLHVAKYTKASYINWKGIKIKTTLYCQGGQYEEKAKPYRKLTYNKNT
jgi:hypothetical protein